MTSRPPFCLLLGALVVSACGGEAPAEETEAEAGRDAQGEVLGGTISDDMIPLDRLRSQSPPMREVPSPAATGGADTTDEPQTDPVAENPVEQAPAPTPAEPAPED